MRFDDYIEMESVNEGVFVDVLKKIAGEPKAIFKKLKDSWNKLKGTIVAKGMEDDALRIINKHFKTNYKTLKQISRDKLVSGYLNEDFAHYWDLIKKETFPVLSFYPALQCFFEIDKLLKGGGDVNIRTLIVYGLFYVFLVSGIYIFSWNKWRISPEGKLETAES